METPNRYIGPKSDAYEKALDGIDLCNERNNFSSENQNVAYQGFQQGRKQSSEFSVRGLWRKKRNITIFKPNQVS